MYVESTFCKKYIIQSYFALTQILCLLVSMQNPHFHQSCPLNFTTYTLSNSIFMHLTDSDAVLILIIALKVQLLELAMVFIACGGMGDSITFSLLAEGSKYGLVYCLSVSLFLSLSLSLSPLPLLPFLPSPLSLSPSPPFLSLPLPLPLSS